jgi:hypothetical protein
MLEDTLNGYEIFILKSLKSRKDRGDELSQPLIMPIVSTIGIIDRAIIIIAR